MSSAKSYKTIFKSTSIVGGSKVVEIAINILRVKVLAVLLGPNGVGLLSLFQSPIGFTSTLTGLGIGNSGVRQTAESVGSGDTAKVSRTIMTVRRVSIVLGLIGMILMIILREPISVATFGSKEYSNSIAFLSVVILFGSVSRGQYALIQGMRRIGDLAKMNIIGSFLGTVVSIICVYYWGRDGIVPFLIAVSGMAILTSWWYARKIRVDRVELSWFEFKEETRLLLSLGFVVMLTGLMSMSVVYFERIMVMRHLGMDGVGLYHAASRLSGLYIGIILGAMAQDFYPRLTAVAKDNSTCNKLVNEQAEIGLLLAVPGLIATLVFAPIVIELLYSSKFLEAYDVLRWQILGVFLRVISWPMGYIQLAKGVTKIFFVTQLISNIVRVLLFWVCLLYWGLTGVGIACFALYVFHFFMINFVAYKLTGFQWAASNFRLGLKIILFVCGVFLLPVIFSPHLSVILGSLMVLLASAYSYRTLQKLMGISFLAKALAFVKR